MQAALTYRLCSVYRVHLTPWTNKLYRCDSVVAGHLKTGYGHFLLSPRESRSQMFVWQATPHRWQCLLKKKSILLKNSSSNRVSGSIAGSTFASQLILSSCQIKFEVYGVHIPCNCEPSRAIMHNTGWQKALSVKTTPGNGKCQIFSWKCQRALY